MKTSVAYLPDESLLAAQEDFTPTAFASLYQGYYARVYNYVRYRCDDPALAEDLTAQAFERVLEKFDSYSPERGPFGAWLFAIARNLVSGHRRAQRYRFWLSIDILHRWPSGEAGPEEATLQQESEAELLAAIGRLDERERDVLGLKFAGLLTNRQIAGLTGLTESNVGVILHRTLYRLRAELGGKDEEHPSTRRQGAVP
jgi:RNA polymerase sigma-70 factor (ECF subfamily)